MTTATPIANMEFWVVNAAPAVGTAVLVVVGTGGRPVPVVRIPVEFPEGMGAPDALEEMG